MQSGSGTSKKSQLLVGEILYSYFFRPSTVKCRAHSVSASSLTLEGRRVRQQDNTLRFEMVTRNDAGTYVCKAKIRGRPINKELAVSVVVNGQFCFKC